MPAFSATDRSRPTIYNPMSKDSGHPEMSPERDGESSDDLNHLVRRNVNGWIIPTGVAFTNGDVGVAFAYADLDATTFWVYGGGRITTVDGTEAVSVCVDPMPLRHGPEAVIRIAFDLARRNEMIYQHSARRSAEIDPWTSDDEAAEVDQFFADRISWLNDQQAHVLGNLAAV